MNTTNNNETDTPDLDALREALAKAEAALKDAEQARDDWEPDSDESGTEEAYDNMLDECHGDFLGMAASRILKECDPTAYRCGFSDWADSAFRDMRESDKRRMSDSFDELCEAVEEAEQARDDAQQELEDAEEEAEADEE